MKTTKRLKYWLQDNKRGQRIALTVTLTACTALIWSNNIQEYKKLHHAHAQAIVIVNTAHANRTERENTPEQVEQEQPAQVLTITEQIHQIAQNNNFDDAALLVRIAKCESTLNPKAKNAHSSATGLFQILDMHGLTTEERENVETSTTWTIEKINAGGLSAWNASRECWSK